jgi:hypothetical protein
MPVQLELVLYFSFDIFGIEVGPFGYWPELRQSSVTGRFSLTRNGLFVFWFFFCFVSGKDAHFYWPDQCLTGRLSNVITCSYSGRCRSLLVVCKLSNHCLSWGEGVNYPVVLSLTSINSTFKKDTDRRTSAAFTLMRTIAQCRIGFLFACSYPRWRWRVDGFGTTCVVFLRQVYPSPYLFPSWSRDSILSALRPCLVHFKI